MRGHRRSDGAQGACFAHCFDSAGSNCGAFSDEQCFQHSFQGTSMLRRRIRTPVEQLQPFERGRIVRLREAGWTYRRIAAHVGYNVTGGVSLLSAVVCGTFLQPKSRFWTAA